MFDGTLGNYTGTEYESELLEGVKPYHAKPFPIPKVHEETLKTEVDRLVILLSIVRITPVISFKINYFLNNIYLSLK